MRCVIIGCTIDMYSDNKHAWSTTSIVYNMIVETIVHHTRPACFSSSSSLAMRRSLKGRVNLVPII